MFLTEAEIAELTGYKYPKKQIEWLRANNYLFEISGDGKPKVLRSHLYHRLGGVVEKKNVEPKLHLK